MRVDFEWSVSLHQAVSRRLMPLSQLLTCCSVTRLRTPLSDGDAPDAAVCIPEKLWAHVHSRSYLPVRPTRRGPCVSVVVTRSC